MSSVYCGQTLTVDVHLSHKPKRNPKFILTISPLGQFAASGLKCHSHEGCLYTHRLDSA